MGKLQQIKTNNCTPGTTLAEEANQQASCCGQCHARSIYKDICAVKFGTRELPKVCGVCLHWQGEFRVECCT
jgi:hypothetical protein